MTGTDLEILYDPDTTDIVVRCVGYPLGEDESVTLCWPMRPADARTLANGLLSAANLSEAAPEDPG